MGEPTVFRIERRPRESDDDALVDVVVDHEPTRPDPWWVTITHVYDGEGNALNEVSMTLAEFRWLVEEAGPKALQVQRDA